MTPEIVEFLPKPDYDPFILELNLREMTADDLTRFINGNLLQIENIKYTGGNTLEHKLLFLIGGPARDVSVATTIKNEPVYTIPPTYPKAPEITEATAAISAYFEIDHNITRVLSEISDIFYNLSHLSVLDPPFSSEYINCMVLMAKTLEYSLRDALLLTAVKYKHRHIDVQRKDPQGEDEVIATLIGKRQDPPSIPIPSDDAIGCVYRDINLIEAQILRPRLVQWQYLHSRDQGNN